MNKWLITAACLVPLLSFSAIAQTQDGAWAPKPVDGTLVDGVINGNLFVPNQRREPRVEPPPGDAGDTAQPVDPSPPPTQTEPQNPDRRYRLIGTSSETGRWLAFIENTESHEISRVAVDGQVAGGSVTLIDYNRIEYTTDTEPVSVLIGRDLTGEMPEAPLNDRLDSLFMPESDVSDKRTETDTPGTSGNNASDARTNPDTPAGADAQRAEILRRLRERRERDSQ